MEYIAHFFTFQYSFYYDQVWSFHLSYLLQFLSSLIYNFRYRGASFTRFISGHFWHDCECFHFFLRKLIWIFKCFIVWFCFGLFFCKFLYQSNSFNIVLVLRSGFSAHENIQSLNRFDPVPCYLHTFYLNLKLDYRLKHNHKIINISETHTTAIHKNFMKKIELNINTWVNWQMCNAHS